MSKQKLERNLFLWAVFLVYVFVPIYFSDNPKYIIWSKNNTNSPRKKPKRAVSEAKVKKKENISKLLQINVKLE